MNRIDLPASTGGRKPRGRRVVQSHEVVPSLMLEIGRIDEADELLRVETAAGYGCAGLTRRAEELLAGN